MIFNINKNNDKIFFIIFIGKIFNIFSEILSYDMTHIVDIILGMSNY